MHRFTANQFTFEVNTLVDASELATKVITSKTYFTAAITSIN